ncbi:hypothetical protein [Mucilaginibacter sp.]|uniref:hypothetical protein n=1 Tax=Mucilaginibacter sp. TaxID=1882438 RepID=UPI00284649C9|nr:hypothetical protein [Mucilaginibacter sp.]MDR3696405.1 hypothetical protein [Mucilaginibacter sp.]
MNPDFITYQKFNDPALAEELAEQLKHYQIKYIIEEQSRTFDPTYAFNNEISTDWAVKISPADFEKANQSLLTDERENITEIGSDYYLFKFTDGELMEVITKADEWSAFDVVLARKLLGERGKSISDEAIAILKNKRIEELKEPDPPQTYWIFIGYICAICGGLLGIFIGWYLTTFKKTLPNGEKVYEYSERDRKHGRAIFYIGLIVLVFCVVFKLAPIFENGY